MKNIEEQIAKEIINSDAVSIGSYSNGYYDEEKVASIIKRYTEPYQKALRISVDILKEVSKETMIEVGDGESALSCIDDEIPTPLAEKIVDVLKARGMENIPPLSDWEFLAKETVSKHYRETLKTCKDRLTITDSHLLHAVGVTIAHRENSKAIIAAEQLLN